jgi:hypothetical protein
MTKLWQLLTDELGSAFKNQYGMAGSSSFDYWARELSEFSEAQLVKGFHGFKNSGSTYMSLNIMRNHCKPKAVDLGLPEFEATYRALILAQWNMMPEAFRVLFAQHRFDLRQLAESEARKRFKPIYENAVRRIAAGEVFKIQERPQIENPSGTTHTKKFGRDQVRTVMNDLLGKMGSRKVRTEA